MKLYDLVRNEDVSGISGVGVVAEVCEFDNGWAVVAFLKHTAGMLLAGVLAAVGLVWLLVATMAATDLIVPSVLVLASIPVMVVSLIIGSRNHSRAAKRWSS